MYHTKTAETAVVTWTHFYCNSSIESKKSSDKYKHYADVSITSAYRSDPPPPFPPQEKKWEGKNMEKKKQQLESSYLQEDFPFLVSALSLFLLFCVQEITNRWRINTSTVEFSFFFETLSCKANHWQRSVRGAGLERQSAGGSVEPCPTRPPPPKKKTKPRKFQKDLTRIKNTRPAAESSPSTSVSAIDGHFSNSTTQQQIKCNIVTKNKHQAEWNPFLYTYNCKMPIYSLKKKLKKKEILSLCRLKGTRFPQYNKSKNKICFPSVN